MSQSFDRTLALQFRKMIVTIKIVSLQFYRHNIDKSSTGRLNGGNQVAVSV